MSIFSVFKPVKRESPEYFIKEYLQMAPCLKSRKPNVIKESKCLEKLILRGICFGDMFGAPYEGTGIPPCDDPDTLDPFKEKSAHITDDTIMSLAIYEATKTILCERRMSCDKMVDIYASHMRKWAKEYPDIGYGGNFYTWALFDQDDPYYKSFGNGSAMRVGVIGAMFASYKDVVKFAVCSAMPTHSHPEGVKGAVVTAVSVWMALQGYTKDEILAQALHFYPDGFKERHEIKEYMSPDISMEQLLALHTETMSVTCQGTVPEAIANLMYSNSYESCLRNALRYKCDSDTVGAISGGIAAALYKNTHFKHIDDNEILTAKFTGDNKKLLHYFMEQTTNE